MNTILSEKEYQKFIMSQLHDNNGYLIRKNDKYNRLFAMDTELLIQFLDSTQSDKMKQLRKIFKEDTESVIISQINTAVTQRNGSLINSLKHGVEISNIKLALMYTKPATDFNKELNEKYSKNIFSGMEEVVISDSERIDLVIFLNGLAIMSFELKCNMAGQDYTNAIYQYRHDRNEKNRLFLHKSGTLVNFAMDLNEVYMTTQLKGMSTTFLPFNKGNGEGIYAGKGNPIYEDKFSVYYMWDEILKKDLVLELIDKFIFIEVSEKTDEITGKKNKKESLIFPRYHQLDCVKKILDDVQVNKTSQNYLIQHSAGSGKTYEIAWLAHRLVSLHTVSNESVFDNIIIVTDRVVIDRQLQDAVRKLDHQPGLIKVMDEDCSSEDLAIALNGNTKIIATTIQKFPYITNSVKKLSSKRFGVIIDEAHSSTAGKDMAAITMALGTKIDYEGEKFDLDTEDLIVDQIARTGKQPNVSMFAFTATPKATTLQIFGRENKFGQREAFHTYSMKQAIEEGFILDVLQSYTTYKTYFEINKKIEEDPLYKNNAAKKKIARFIALHETNINQRVEIIIEHFRENVMHELGGQAKAMVVTSSRAEAVRYREAFEEYSKRKGYNDVKALVAFSGKISGDTLGKGYSDLTFTESSLNGFSEDKTPAKFDSDEYQVLIVANKYQTGFDQPKLCAMYILKKLKGVNCVQTLSRLNRTCHPYDKKVFVLDFMNDYDDILSAFAPYYTTTLLCNTVTPEAVYDLESDVDDYNLIDIDDILLFNEILYSGKTSTEIKAQVNSYLLKSKKVFEKLDEKEQRECYLTLRKFIRFYEFLLLVSSFEDADLHKKYNYINYLVAYLRVKNSGVGFSLDDKIKADGFVQKNTGEHKKHVDPKPEIRLAMTSINLTEDEEKKLSEIIEEINSRAGKSYNSDVAVKAMLQIKDIMMKSDALKKSALANSENDFEFTYFDNVDDALVEGIEQNRDFFTLLLENDDMKKEVLGVFAHEIYRSFRERGVING